MDKSICNIDFSQYLFDSEARVEEDSSSNPSANKLIDTQTDITKQYIFVNLNADGDYNEFQYNKVIKDVIKDINKRRKLQMVIQWYFERSDLNRLHVHGMISNVPITYWPYGKLCKDIAKAFHLRIGRPRLAHRIAADIQWADNNEAVANYCKKDKGSEHIYSPKNLF